MNRNRYIKVVSNDLVLTPPKKVPQIYPLKTKKPTRAFLKIGIDLLLWVIKVFTF